LLFGQAHLQALPLAVVEVAEVLKALVAVAAQPTSVVI
jgi:hypothetical protein